MTVTRLIGLLYLLLWGSAVGATPKLATYVPTMHWPYLFEEFQTGEVYFSNDQASKPMLLNIHLLHCTLHFLNGDEIRQADTRDIERIVFSKDTFIFNDGELVHLIKANEVAALVKRVKANLDNLSKSTGAYGMNTDVASVKKLSSIGLGGLSNLSHRQMKIEREDDEELPVSIDYFFIIHGKNIHATRKGMDKSLPESDRSMFKAFLKTNKIKWSEEEDLLRVLNLFHP